MKKERQLLDVSDTVACTYSVSVLMRVCRHNHSFLFMFFTAKQDGNT